MTSGIQSKGTDLDSIFAAYVSGTHPAATGIEVNGTDIATRYQPLPGTSAAATGIHTNGADLNTLFSTTSGLPNLSWNGDTFAAATAQASGTNQAQVRVYFNTAANTYEFTVLSNDVTYTYPYTYPSGATEFYIVWTTTSTTGDGGEETNNASSWTQLSELSATDLMFTLATTATTGAGPNAVVGTLQMFFGANSVATYQGTADVSATSTPAS